MSDHWMRRVVRAQCTRAFGPLVEVEVTASALDVTGRDRRHIVRAYLSVCARRGSEYLSLPDVVPATAEQSAR